MEQQNNKILREYSRYANFCTRISDNLANGSDYVSRLMKLNTQLVLEKHLPGRFEIQMTRLKNLIVQNRFWNFCVSFLFFELVVMGIDEIRISFNQLVEPALFRPLLLSVIFILFFRKESAIPFVKIADEDKTSEYAELESLLKINQVELNELKSQYESFIANSSVADFVARLDEIEGPTIENQGNFSYPLINNRFKYAMHYLKTGQADTLEKAGQMADDKLQDHHVEELSSHQYHRFPNSLKPSIHLIRRLGAS
jgi:hypothetical protein